MTKHRHPMAAAMLPRLLDEETAAAYLGRGRTRFREQVAKGDIPGPSDRNGNVSLWDIRLLDLYVDERSGIGASSKSWD